MQSRPLIKEVTAYESSDGVIYRTQEEAESREVIIRLSRFNTNWPGILYPDKWNEIARNPHTRRNLLKALTDALS